MGSCGSVCSQLVVLPSPQPTTMNQFRAEGLNPYLEYELDVSALNEFTMLNQPLVFDPGFGRDARVRTLEGGMLVCVLCVCVPSSLFSLLSILHTQMTPASSN